jgi:hypothetical protein
MALRRRYRSVMIVPPRGTDRHRVQSRSSSDMDVGYISALSALAGSVIGGLTSGVTTWLNQRSLARAGLLEHEISRRQDLYKDFIIAASRAYAEALVVNEPKIDELIALYAMISRMRAMSSSEIVACAERVLLETTGAYFEPNRTVPELRELIKDGTSVDPLKDFAEAVREERRQSAHVYATIYAARRSS